MRTAILSVALLAGLPAVAIVGCSTAPESVSGQQELHDSAQAALSEALRRDPTLRQTLDRSAGYAVFPTVGKGGFVVGGSYGKGVLYEKGLVTGYCDISSLAAGALIGGQEYSEIIAFETPKRLADFKGGDFAFAADASAVAVKEGAAAATKFDDGVAVFVYDQAGLMADASLGGEKYRFTPTGEAQPAAGKVDSDKEPVDIDVDDDDIDVDVQTK